jgi:serine/threonine protein kinase
MRKSLYQIDDVISDAAQPPNCYRIVSILGEGNSGITYAGEDMSHPGVTIAIKVLSFQQTNDWKMWELCDREAKVLAQLQHRGIPRYLNSFHIDTEDDRRFYIVQELVPGKSLAAWVENGWHTNEAGVRQIAQQLLEILVYLQRLNPPVIHRDIKPQNIIRREDGSLSLVDFGAVRDTYYSTLMRGSTVVGTYGYMAPEQFQGKAVSATDLYGLGATLLFLLTHRSPTELPANGLAIDFRSHIQVSDSFANWLEKLLEPDANERFVSAQAALIALRKPTIPKTAKLVPRDILFGSMLVICVGFWLSQTFKWKVLGTFGLAPPDICENNISVLRDYLQQGGNPNLRTNYIRTFSVAGSTEYPLLFCVSKEGAELLLKHGANPNIEESGEPILYKAVLANQPDLLKLLLKYGANPNSTVKIPQHNDPSYYFPVLQGVVEAGNKEIAEILINHGADVNAQSRDRETALDVAVRLNQVKIAQILLAKGGVAIRNPDSKRLRGWQQEINVHSFKK